MLLPDFTQAKTIEVYIHYDRPLLFACEDIERQKYLAVMAEQDDEENEIWLYVPVSDRRLAMVRSGGIDLHNAFGRSETDVAYLVEIENTGKIKTSSIKNNEIKESWLPRPETKLHKKTDTLPQKKITPAISALRDRIALKFNFADYTRSEAPAYRLGEILCNFQEALDEIVTLPASMRVVGFAPGSFEIELESETQVNLFNESRVGEGIQKLLDIIELVEDEDKLIEALKKLKPDAAKSVGKLAKSLTGIVNSTEIHWDSPSPELGSKKEISASQALRIYQEINKRPQPIKKIIPVKGTLLGLDIESRHFRIISESNQEYSGYIITESLIDPIIRHAQISQTYIASIEERLYEKWDDSNPTITHYLVRLDQI